MSAEQSQVIEPRDFTSLSDYQFLGNNNTVERKLEFLTAYREEGSIFHACAKCRMSRRTVYVWAEEDPQFAEAMADSKEDTYDNLETSVYKRAFKSDLLAMFYLKAHRPKFRDKVQVDVTLVQDEIDSMMGKLSSEDRLRLQPAVTEFIDTSFDSSTNEYQRISPTSEHSQKEQPPE